MTGDLIERLDPVLLACLRSGQKSDLRRRSARLVCPASAEKDIGWFPRANWSDWQVDSGLGGPWSVETVAHLCGLGLLGVHPDSPDQARVTREGAATIRKVKAAEKARTAASSSSPATVLGGEK